jgi:hypothetical protein
LLAAITTYKGDCGAETKRIHEFTDRNKPILKLLNREQKYFER